MWNSTEPTSTPWGDAIIFILVIVVIVVLIVILMTLIILRLERTKIDPRFNSRTKKSIPLKTLATKEKRNNTLKSLRKSQQKSLPKSPGIQGPPSSPVPKMSDNTVQSTGFVVNRVS